MVQASVGIVMELPKRLVAHVVVQAKLIMVPVLLVMEQGRLIAHNVMEVVFVVDVMEQGKNLND